jgi:sugar/nucleoside kinase (ribokinase family)
VAEGSDVAASMRFAAAAGALKARNGRGWDGMPTRAEVDKMIEGVHA